MYSHQDQFIHDMSVKQILSILQHGAWKVLDQQRSSSPACMESDENTCGIHAFANLQFEKDVKVLLDIGGGKSDINRAYLKANKNIEVLVWDPFNRSTAHNLLIQKIIMKNKADSVSSMSVLNVIAEAASRLAHICTVKSGLKSGGKAYFKIWPGEALLKGSYLPSATLFSYQANAFRDRFIKEIELVFGRGSVRSSQTPNLLIAKKMTDALPAIQEILAIQKESKAYCVYLKT